MQIEAPNAVECGEGSDTRTPLKKKYTHWETEVDRKQNQDAIIGYDFKKRSVDKATLTTQRDLLIRYGNYFDKPSVERIESELGSNKVEIYNSPYFASHFAQDHGNYIVTGLRTVKDGKICLRDTDNVESLTHTATHEAVHDSSFQRERAGAGTLEGIGGQDIGFSRAENMSGIERIEKLDTTTSEGVERCDLVRVNRYLNEGFTELCTIEEMERRGETPDFTSYTEELGWAYAIRERVGEEIAAGAYFGGDVATLEKKVNSMSDIPNAWRILNDHIDAFHVCDDVQERNQHKKVIEDIILSLRGSREFGGRKVR